MKKTLLFVCTLLISSWSLAASGTGDVVLNEIYSRGTSSNPDWIEIYNPSSSGADISGYKIYDTGGQSGSKPKKELPSGTLIPAHGYYVIVTDDGTSGAFGLSSSGEEVWLEDSSGIVIDSVNFPALAAGQSYGRIPDGGSWQILYTLSRGSANSSFVAGSPVVMNEVYSRGTNTDPDWIELYNSSTSPVDISNYKIYDTGGETGSKPKKEFPAGTIIPGRGFYVIVTDDTTAGGFGLSGSGEEVWLENDLRNVIDTVNFPALSSDQSYARMPDGGNWQVVNNITRGESNNYSSAYNPIVLNEVYTSGNSSPDWIELFNLSGSSVDIGGYRIFDHNGESGSLPKKEIPSGTVIDADGFYIIVTNDSSSGSFDLPAAGEKIWLQDSSGTSIDSVTYPTLTKTESYGRVPDGGNWQLLNSPTKGGSNINFLSGSKILMNEIYTRGTSSNPDWIEIYNTSSLPVDISGYRIYDIGGQSGTKPKKELPAGTFIAGNNFMVIVTDDTTASGFGLSNSGEKVWLENAGQSVIDTVTFPALEDSLSYGRIPDGGEWHILNRITRGKSNVVPTALAADEPEYRTFRLFQNYPNPCSGSTTISFSIPIASYVSVSLMDGTGNEIKILFYGFMQPGTYHVQWNSGVYPSGIYFYELNAGNFHAGKKLIIQR